MRILALWTEKNTSISPSGGKLHRVKIHHAPSNHSSISRKKLEALTIHSVFIFYRPSLQVIIWLILTTLPAPEALM